MASVTTWTGGAACALQAALRMSNRLFAEHLGVHERTVAAWHEKPTMRPRSEQQQLLDTALEQASPAVQKRFVERITRLEPVAEESAPGTEPTTEADTPIPLPEVLAADATSSDLTAERAWQQLVYRSGEVVELGMRVALDIQEDGWARVTYQHTLANLGDRPMSRLARQVWFEHTGGPLQIAPVENDTRRITIHRTHDTPSSAQFAVLISPPIKPGDSAIVGYTCEGGRFVTDHYWRQSIARHTRQFKLHLYHRGAAGLMDYTAVEEHPDGAENSATDALEWDELDGAVDLTLTRQNLRPGQAVTLRWEVRRAAQ